MLLSDIIPYNPLVTPLLPLLPICYRTGASYSSTGLLPPGLTADKVRELNTKVQKLNQQDEGEQMGEEEVSVNL